MKNVKFIKYLVFLFLIITGQQSASAMSVDVDTIAFALELIGQEYLVDGEEKGLDDGVAPVPAPAPEDEQDLEAQIRWEHWCEFNKNRAYNIAISSLKAGTALLLSGKLMRANKDFLTFAGIISMGFRDKIEFMINDFNQALFPPEQQRELYELELEFKLKKAKLPKQRREFLQERITKLKKTIVIPYRYRNGSLSDDAAQIKHLKTILSLPSERIILDQDRGEQAYRKIQEAMEKTYDQELVTNIKMLAFQIINDSGRGESKNAGKSSSFFLGVPGTGKTTTAQLLAESLGLPFEVINLSKIDPKELSCSVGPHEDGVTPCGKIAEAFLKPKAALNTIFFLDEVHDALDPDIESSKPWQAQLKRLLDPDQVDFFDEDLKVMLDLSGAIFILAGNLPPDDTAGALMNRMTTYTFKPASPKARLAIAKQSLTKTLDRFGLEPDRVSLEDEVVLNILKFDAENCANEGVRAMQRVIMSYVRNLAAVDSGVVADGSFNCENEFDRARGISRAAWLKQGNPEEEKKD